MNFLFDIENNVEYFTLLFINSVGQELQINQHTDPQPSHPFNGRGCRLHRIRPTDSICGQVSLMMPTILDYLAYFFPFFYYGSTTIKTIICIILYVVYIYIYSFS